MSKPYKQYTYRWKCTDCKEYDRSWVCQVASRKRFLEKKDYARQVELKQTTHPPEHNIEESWKAEDV